jgi:hypothetical protein
VPWKTAKLFFDLGWFKLPGNSGKLFKGYIYIWDKYKYIYNYIYIREIYGIDLGNLGEIPSLLGFVGGSHFVDSLGYSWGYRISFCR